MKKVVFFSGVLESSVVRLSFCLTVFYQLDRLSKTSGSVVDGLKQNNGRRALPNQYMLVLEFLIIEFVSNVQERCTGVVRREHILNIIAKNGYSHCYISIALRNWFKHPPLLGFAT